MNEKRYAALSAPFRGRTPSALLRYADKALTTMFYILYPLLILLLALGVEAPFASHISRVAGSFTAGSFSLHPMLAPCIVAPAAGFLVASFIRKAINAPRPYEALRISPILIKDTEGQSFPSKHVFSSFCIATCWLAYCAPAGCALYACAGCIAVIRVIGGVHWPRDVIAGALLGIAIGAIVFIW